MTLPYSENQRLQALHQLGILDTPKHPLLDALTQMACSVFNVPIALVSLVDEHRQWFKSAQGLDVCQTERDISFCTHALNNPNEPFIIPDATQDARFSNNPLVLGTPFVVFYAGVPLNIQLSLESTDGAHTETQSFCIGTFCIIDHQPRSISAQQLQQLKQLADQASYIIQTQYTQRHYQDILTTLRTQQQQLQAQHQKMQALARDQQIIIDQSPSAVIQINPKGQIVLWSERAHEIFGFRAQEMVGATAHAITPKRHWHFLDDIHKELAAGRSVDSKIAKNVTKNSKGIVCQWYYRPLLDAQGHVDGALCFAKDITQLWQKERQDKQTQEQLQNTIAVRDDELRQSIQALELTQAQLVQSERHKAIGQTVAGIAHDINTPISNAHLLSQTLKEQLQALRSCFSSANVRRSQLHEHLQTLEELRFVLESNLSSGLRLLNNFKQLSIDHVKEPLRVLDVQDLVLQNITMLHYRMDDKMVPVYVHAYTPLLIQSYPGTIGQVLQNIFVNAFEHGFLQEFSSSLFIDVLTLNPSDPDPNIEPGSPIQEIDHIPKVHVRQLDPSIVQSVHNLQTYALSGPLSNGTFWSPQGHSENDFFAHLQPHTNYVYLRICDTGKGVDPKQYEHLFEPYYSQSKPALSGGSGIGLSIVKHLVETLLQGRIAVRSIPNIGFEVHLLFKHLQTDSDDTDLAQLLEL